MTTFLRLLAEADKGAGRRRFTTEDTEGTEKRNRGERVINDWCSA
jgi:hypothetical protein